MIMRLASLVGGVAVLLAGAALAAPGDALLVSGSNVNVRAGPSTDAGVLTRVGLHAPAIERRREGQWVEVELPEQDVLGWIHDSLLTGAPAQAATDPAPADVPSLAEPEIVAMPVAAVEPVAAPSRSDGTALGRFRSEVEYFNNRAIAAAGVDLFTGVSPLGEDGVQVMTTDAWATMSQSGQQSYLNALFGRWQAAAGADRALRLQIIDSSGTLMVEKTAP
jgi:hypothetical protein